MIGVGLYGSNGHQLFHRFAQIGVPGARLVAAAAMPDVSLSELAALGASHEASLEALLSNPAVDLVSLCSPRRADQAGHAIACLEAGRHVYAEKPCALSEADLDAVLAAAARTGRRFHEMAGTAFAQPYRAMRETIRRGVIGEVVQVNVEKSYPYHPRRPQDESIDGGLLMQAGVHGTRMIEHVAGKRVASVRAFETRHGNPDHAGGLRMAAALAMELEGGGVATLTANYLNVSATGVWGYEQLRVYGTRGIVESTGGGESTRLFIDGWRAGPLDVSVPSLDYFDFLVASLDTGAPMPMTSDEELHPTRVVLRAKRSVGW